MAVRSSSHASAGGHFRFLLGKRGHDDRPLAG